MKKYILIIFVFLFVFIAFIWYSEYKKVEDFKNEVVVYLTNKGFTPEEYSTPKYVKRKVVNDTLYVMCIPNTKKMHLQSAKDDFFKISNDLIQNNNSKKSDNSKSNTFKNQLSDYIQSLSSVNNNSLADSQSFWLPVKFQNTLSSPHISPEQPPDVNLA